jgi:hypothetical protein
MKPIKYYHKKDPKGSFLVYDQLEFSRKKYAKTGGKRLKKPKIEGLHKKYK